MIARTGRRSNLNCHIIDRLSGIDEHMEEAEVTLNESQKERSKKDETLKMMKGDLKYRQMEFNVRMVDEFIAYGKHIFCPCFDYHHKQFLYPDGDLYRLQKSAIAAQLFDPFIMRGVIIEILRVLNHELVHFELDPVYGYSMC